MSDQATSIVIFGASGDLTKRKLIPALYNLFIKGRLPKKLVIVGNSRTDFTHKAWRERMEEGVKEFSENSYKAADWKKFAKHLWYVAGSADKKKDMQALDAFLQDKEKDVANRLYYLSVAPFLYVPIVQNLGALKLAQTDGGWRRIIVEKPFGTDLESAQALNQEINAIFEENQVYRIDHYLGKETSQNIMFLRFANAIFEPLWNRNYIDNVQITVIESVDVGHRGGYYEKSGVLRDMFQNHLLQLLTLVAMEPPPSFDADLVRNEKAKVLESVRAIDPADTVLAQYEGYRETEEVDPDSQVPTYAALKLFIDNWRWQGVPFYLRSGKALERKLSEIVVTFRRPPLRLFNNSEKAHRFESNVLSICIQPDEGIHLSFEAKVPDSPDEARSVDMEFHYDKVFGPCAIPEAYERLILDAIQGDASLFTRSDGIEISWEIIDPVIKAWEADDAPKLASYPRGSHGPQEADALLAANGHLWVAGCIHEDEKE